MADSNRLTLLVKEQSAFGTAASGSGFNTVRFTSESLASSQETTESAEIRADRAVSNIIRTDIGAGGSINGEILCTDTVQELLYLCGLQATAWPAEASAVTGVDAVASGNTFDKTSAWGAYAENDWIRASGFVGAANNGLFKVTAVAANTLTVAGNTLVDDATSVGTIELASTITNGTNLVPSTGDGFLTVEKEFADTANEFALFRDMAVAGISLSLERGSVGTVNFALQGALESSATATVATSPTAASTVEPVNSVENVQGILEGEALYACQQVSFNIQNALRPLTQLGTLGATSMGNGSMSIEGAHTAVYSSKAIIDKMLDYDTSSVAYILKDGAGNALAFDFPSVKYTGATRLAGGRDQFIQAEMTWRAFLDATESVMVRAIRTVG